MKKIMSLTFIVSGFFTLNLGAMIGESKPAAMASAPAQVPARAPKLAFINPQKVIEVSDEWRDKVAEVQKDFEKRVTNLQKEREALIQKSRNSAALPAAERESMKDLAKQQKNLEIEEQALQMEVQRTEQELQMAIAQKVDAAIEAVAKANGYDAVLPKFFYVNKDFDITTAVSDQMNKDYKKEKAAAKFKKEAAKPTAPVEAKK